MLIDRPAARLAQRADGFEVTAGAPGSFRRGHDPHAFEPAGERRPTTPSSPPCPTTSSRAARRRARCRDRPEYLERLRGIEYHTALCLLLELDRRFSPTTGPTSPTPSCRSSAWSSTPTSSSPSATTAGASSTSPTTSRPATRCWSSTPTQLLERYTPGLRKVNPGFDRSWIKQRWLHREPAAQPIVTVGYPERIPPLQTGVPHLVLANTTQIYPEDRGTNYAVRLGGEAAEALLSRRLNNVWSETGS